MNLKDLDKTDQTPVLAEDILARMRMGKSTTSEIRMGNQTIPVRILSADEVNAVRNEAKALANKMHGDETDMNLNIQKFTLQMASIVTKDGIPFLSDKIMKMLSVDEIGYLYSELIKFWDEFNPALEQVTPERFRALVEALKKNNRLWSDCSLPERRAIFMCFVDMIQRPDSQTSPQAS